MKKEEIIVSNNIIRICLFTFVYRFIASAETGSTTTGGETQKKEKENYNIAFIKVLVCISCCFYSSFFIFASSF